MDKDAVEIERAVIKERAGLVPKTVSKVETDVRTWDLYVKEQQVEIDAYPSIEQTVSFAIWMTRHRERACLAQRVEAKQQLTGKVRRTIRNMVTELLAHVWPRRWAAFAALARSERVVYENEILKQVDHVHKLAALSTTDGAGGVEGKGLRVNG